MQDIVCGNLASDIREDSGRSGLAIEKEKSWLIDATVSVPEVGK